MDEKQQIYPRAVGALSEVPYGEPTWLTKGYYSPYYKDVRCLVSLEVIFFDMYTYSIIVTYKSSSGNLWK